MEAERLLEQALAQARANGDATGVYHLEQFVAPKAYTRSLMDFMAQRGLPAPGSVVLDAGCGYGANLHHFSQRFPGISWIGLDLSAENLAMAGRLLSGGTNLVQGDLYDPPPMPRIDGIICLQTLSWLERPWLALDNLLTMAPEWLLLTSLFYDGPVEAEIRVTQPAPDGTPSRHCYNVYSLPDLARRVERRGYRLVVQEPFEIDIDLPKPSHGRMGTYTRRSAEGERLQFSGPLFMPWHTVFIQGT